jgi:hypothetical protein
LVDALTGAFKSEQEPTAAASATEPKPQVQAAAPVAVVQPVVVVQPQVAAQPGPQTAGAQPQMAVPSVSTATVRPNRRPGPGMAAFKEMARELAALRV